MIPQNSLDSLEFNKLLEIIAGYAHSDASRDTIFSITPLSSRVEIEKRFACVKEIWLMRTVYVLLTCYVGVIDKTPTFQYTH